MTRQKVVPIALGGSWTLISVISGFGGAKMVHRWFRKPKSVTSVPLILLLLLALACGTAAEPPATPTTAPVARATPTTAPVTAEATSAPTAMPQATNPPGDAVTSNPELAPPFAEYWTPRSISTGSQYWAAPSGSSTKAPWNTLTPRELPLVQPPVSARLP
jgi:hypothetical protein